MRTSAKLGMIVAAGALAITVPAAADPGHPPKPHKCVTHNVAYVAHGTVVSWSTPPTGSGRYSGALNVDVTKTNHHANGQKGNPSYPYTLLNAKVTFGHGVTGSGIGDPVNVIGKIAVAPKDPKCTSSTITGTPVGTITITKVVVHAPKTS